MNPPAEMLDESETAPRILVDEFRNASEETKRALAGDTVTLLRAASKQTLAKIWRPDGSIKPAACVKWFMGKELAIAAVEDICRVLDAVENRPSIAFVKEALAPGTDPRRLRRMTVAGVDKRTREPFKAGLIVIPRRWIALDIEGLPRPTSIDFRDGDALANHARNLLPSEFKGAACVWQMSGSSGHPSRLNEIRLHLFFMLDTPIFPKAWKYFFAGRNNMNFIDRGAFDRVKIIFTAAPQIFVGRDPVERRHGLLAGEPVVAVPSAVRERSAGIGSGADEEERRSPLSMPAAPMPQAAAEFFRIISQAGILRSQGNAYCGDRTRRLAFCSVLRSAFGIADEAMLTYAFWEVCVGDGDAGGEHDLQQALDWSRRPSPSGRTFSARKMLCDAAATARQAGNVVLAARAARFAMAFWKIESGAA
jgi:hypothetical protein